MWPGTSVGEDLYRRVVFNRGPYDKVAKLFFGNGYIMGALTTTLNRRYKWNYIIECLDCNEVLYDVEKDEDKLTKSIKKVLEYLWGDEQSHFEEYNLPDHIFTHLKTIRDEMGLAGDEFPDEDK